MNSHCTVWINVMINDPSKLKKPTVSYSTCVLNSCYAKQVKSLPARTNAKKEKLLGSRLITRKHVQNAKCNTNISIETSQMVYSLELTTVRLGEGRKKKKESPTKIYKPKDLPSLHWRPILAQCVHNAICLLLYF